MPRQDARLNRLVGWLSLCTGAVTGLILGLWSFGGPLAVPAWLGDYGDTSRRMARLGHIAFFGLGIINILVARELPRLSLSARTSRLCSFAMNFGNIFLPITLFVAAAWHPLKYLFSLPALCVTAALFIVAFGAWNQDVKGDSA